MMIVEQMFSEKKNILCSGGGFVKKDMFDSFLRYKLCDIFYMIFERLGNR